MTSWVRTPATHGWTGDTCVAGVQKYLIPCNWKFAVDNVWDFYHPGISHASQQMAGWSKIRTPLVQTLTRLAPDWRDPRSGRTVRQLLARLRAR